MGLELFPISMEISRIKRVGTPIGESEKGKKSPANVLNKINFWITQSTISYRFD